MIKNILKEKIKKSIESNSSFAKLLENNYQTLSTEDILIKETDDYLLSKEDIYKFSNFKELFYETIMNFNSNRLGNFLRNVLNDNPKKEITYEHILNDIESKLENTYNIPNSYIKMKRSELDNLCDELILREDYFALGNIRKFIKDNFRVHSYNSYIKENRDLAIKILKSGGADETDKSYARLRKLLEANPNYIGAFTYFNKIEKIPFISLKRLYDRILQNNDILNMLPELIVNYIRHKLPYKTPDGRTYRTHFERLTDDMTSIEEKQKAKLFANEYYPDMRKPLLENPDFTEVVKELTSDPEKMEMYKKFFLKKIARYKTPQELLDALISFVYKSGGDDDFRQEVINTYNADIVYDDGDELLVIRVRNYEAIQKLASDTSWCIKDSLSYWTDYVGTDTVQLIIMELKEPKSSLYRKIGVTINNQWGGKISFNTAHLKNDSYISEDQLNKRLEKYGTNLQELYDAAKGFGSNEYYDTQEIQNDRYGN